MTTPSLKRIALPELPRVSVLNGIQLGLIAAIAVADNDARLGCLLVLVGELFHPRRDVREDELLARAELLLAAALHNVDGFGVELPARRADAVVVVL